MLKLLTVFLFFPFASFSVITSATTWEIHQGSSDLDGGGFDATIAGAGTDLSPFDNKNAAGCTSCQSTTVNISTTDAVTAGTTTITSATANFSSAIVGNTIYVTGGTGAVVAQRYQVVTFTNSTTIVVDRSTGLTAGTGTTMNIGGALGTPTEAETVRAVVAGNTVYIKANATYTTTAAFTFSTTNGSSGLPISWVGYTSTRTDGGQPTLQISSGTGINILTGTATFQRFYNLSLDCNTKGTSRGASMSGSQYLFANMKFANCTTAGIRISTGQTVVKKCLFTGMTSAATAAVDMAQTGNTLIGNRITGNASPGIVDSVATTTNSNTYIDNIIDNNTGTTSDGFQKTSTAATVLFGNSIYKNGRDGIRMTAAGSLDGLTINNNIIYGNGVSTTGVGINSTTTDWSSSNLKLDIDYNALDCNNSASTCTNAADRVFVAAGVHDVALTGDPFTNGGSNDFSLNNTAGAGAAARAAGFPGVLQSGGTGKIDIGALQHTDSGGGQKAWVSVQ